MGPETPLITTCCAAFVYREVKVRCADRDLHSGMFGGGARNPIHVLAKIIADLHDADGRVTIPGFYDGVHETPPEVLQQWRALDLTPEKFLGQVGLGIPAGERDRMLIEQIQSRPTCDANGIVGGYTGVGSKTVIAGEASAKISFRLSATRIRRRSPRPSTPSSRSGFRRIARSRSSATAPRGRSSSPSTCRPSPRRSTALTEEWGREAVMIGTGGSIPIVGDFKRTLGLDTVLIGFDLDDDRVHSPNEKYDLSSFHKGT